MAVDDGVHVGTGRSHGRLDGLLANCQDLVLKQAEWAEAVETGQSLLGQGGQVSRACPNNDSDYA